MTRHERSMCWLSRLELAAITIVTVRLAGDGSAGWTALYWAVLVICLVRYLRRFA